MGSITDLVNVGPEIPQRDRAAASVSREMGVKKILKLSSLDVEHGLAIGAWHKEEAAIAASEVPFTLCAPQVSCRTCSPGRMPSRRNKS
jgi:hypothetical protein